MRHLTTHECQCVSGGISLVPANTTGVIAPYSNGTGAQFNGLTVLPDFQYPRLPPIVPGAPISIALGNSLNLVAPSVSRGGSEA